MQEIFFMYLEEKKLSVLYGNTHLLLYTYI